MYKIIDVREQKPLFTCNSEVPLKYKVGDIFTRTKHYYNNDFEFLYSKTEDYIVEQVFTDTEQYECALVRFCSEQVNDPEEA